VDLKGTCGNICGNIVEILLKHCGKMLKNGFSNQDPHFAIVNKRNVINRNPHLKKSVILSSNPLFSRLSRVINLLTAYTIKNTVK